MNRKQFDKLRDEAYARICEISDRKGHDYSGDEDALRNFKTNGEALGISRLQVWGVLCIKHWDAVMTYIREGDVASEPIEGRIDDVILYLFLLQALVKDETMRDIEPELKSALVEDIAPLYNPPRTF